MKAVVVESGDLKWGQAPAPRPGPEDIEIRTRASGVNRADCLQRRGLYPPPPGTSPLLGLEAAGEVVRVGEKVTRFRPGDRVMALLAGGGYGEFVVVPETHALPVPPDWSWAEAGGLMETFLTAYLNLWELGGAETAEAVLVHAGASGVGTAAITLLKRREIPTFATVSSAEKVRLVESLGAVPVRYREVDFASHIRLLREGRGVSLVLDCVGGESLARNLEVLDTEGTLVLIGLMGGRRAEIDLGAVLTKRLRLQGSTLRALPHSRKASLIQRFWSQWKDDLQSGRIRPRIDRTVPVHRAWEAHQYMEANQTRGKVVLLWD